ncbi:MAG: chorismate-binding protein [Salinibacterium sp.]|nr:chorismate-binding protein [Salinibacterium sp.]
MKVSTEASTDHGSLVERLGSRHPLAFLRDGDGIVGLGETLRLEFAGPTRITDAATMWRALVERATVVDAVGLPGTGLVAFGSFAFADSSAATSVLIVPSVILGRREGVSWVTRIGAAPSDEPQGDPFTASFGVGALSAEGYQAAVEVAVGRIRSGEPRKVVLARDIVASIPADADLRLPFGTLAAAYPDTFTFAVAGLMGSSPETLVRCSAGTVNARVLAGSAARGADAESDASAAATLTASLKDVEEHALALRSVITALEPLSTALSSTPPFPLRLPNLWHLASDVSGFLTRGSSALDLIAALHPTAAVAGTPTELALAIIAELEPFDRGRYAGPVGWVDGNGDGEWAVALRCAQVDGTQVTAYAGAGIVAGSDPARELAETTLKLRPIVEAFG